MSINKFSKAVKKRDRYSYVRSLLTLHGIKQKSIAEKIGVSRAFVCMVLHGKAESRRVKTAVAAALGETVVELWGENGNGNGTNRGRKA